jgi:hypothetical protein
MKKLLLIAATLLASEGAMSIDRTKNEITDSFTDRVKEFQEEDQEIVVHFTRHSSLYKVPKSNPRFLELKSKLEKLKKDEKKVKVVAVLPMMEIRELTE